MIDPSKYKNIKIPDNLHRVVQDAIREGLASTPAVKQFSVLKRVACAAAGFILCVATLLNASPVFASVAYNIPVVGDICRVLTLREYHVADEVKYIDVKIPKIENTGKSELEQRVNLEIQKVMHDCVTENEVRAEEYYDAFVATGGDPEDFTPVGITVDYAVKQVNDKYVSFVVSQYETNFSAYAYDYYYNIDLESGRILTLKDCLGEDYRQIAADSMEQSISSWEDDKKALLWDDLSIIDLISEHTDFYMDEHNQIVVVLDKYEAAAGAAGILEFTLSPNG